MNVAAAAPVAVLVVAAVADAEDLRNSRIGCFLDYDTVVFLERSGDKDRLGAHQNEQARYHDGGEAAKRDENGRFCDGDV